MKRTPNKSQHVKLTLQKKILSPLLQGFDLATCWSCVRRSISKLPRLSDRITYHATFDLGSRECTEESLTHSLLFQHKYCRRLFFSLSVYRILFNPVYSDQFWTLYRILMSQQPRNFDLGLSMDCTWIQEQAVTTKIYFLWHLIIRNFFVHPCLF